MKYVIDSSVAFKWVVTEIDSDKALQLRDGYRQSIHLLLAQDLFPIEVANSLASAEKSRRILIGEAAIFLVDVLNNVPVIHESSPLLSRAVEICLSTRHSVYDSLYVALAEREQCELVTADDKLVKSLQPTFPFITALSSLP